MDKDNIPNSSTNTSPNSELSCTDHSWYIKAIDNNGNSTNSNTFNLNINCGTGFIAPIKPNISATTLTLSSDGKLNLNNLPADITQIAISTTPDFKDVSWDDISKKDELLQKYADASKLYLKFKTKDGAVSDTITYEKSNSNNPISPSSYPTGTLLKLPNSPRVYVIIDGKKKWISTPEVFEQLGYKWTDIRIVTETELNTLTDYEDNLIRQQGDYKVYLVVNGIKRHIPNPEVFLDYGFSWNDIKEVDKATMDKYKETFLIKESGKNEIYYIIDGIKRWIPTMDVFNSYNYNPEDVQIISKKEMGFYPLSNLIRLNDSNDVYLTEGNIKKHISNPQVFNKYKLNWNYVMSVNQTEFNFYQNGGELK